MPGVSRKTICASGVVTTPWIDVRVVCGLSATIATFCPTRAFRRVDLPALGRPMIETKPDWNFLLMRYRLRLADADLFDPEIVACEHVDANAIAVHHLACLRHTTEPLADETANRGRFQIFFRPERRHKIA